MKQQNGFVLIELIVAFGLLLLVMSLIWLGIGRGAAPKGAQSHFMALQIARSELETLRSQGVRPGTFTLSPRGGQMLRQLPKGQGKVTVLAHKQSGLNHVQVSINWQGRSQPKTVKLDTLIGAAK